MDADSSVELPAAQQCTLTLDSGGEAKFLDVGAQSCSLVVNELLSSLQFFNEESVDEIVLERCFMRQFSAAEIQQAHMVLNGLLGQQQVESSDFEETGGDGSFVQGDGAVEVKPEVSELSSSSFAHLAVRVRKLRDDERFVCSFVARDLSRVVTPLHLQHEENGTANGGPRAYNRRRGKPSKSKTTLPRNLYFSRGRPPASDVADSVTPVISEKRVPKPSAKARAAQDMKDALSMLVQIKEEEGTGQKKVEPDEPGAEVVKRKRGRPKLSAKKRPRVAEDGTVFMPIEEFGKIPKEIREGSYNESTSQYECRQCGKGFDAVQTLKRHWGAHEARKKNVCTECGKTFTSSSGLRDHMMIHSGQKPHQCDLCGAFFRRLCSVQRHRLTHENARPYMCHVCGKCFSASSVLAIHRRTHTGETPYACKFCGQTFVRRTALKNHEHIHTGERPYKCKICGKSYGNAGTYWHHQQLHKKEEQQQHIYSGGEMMVPKQEMSPQAVLLAPNARSLQFDAVVAAAEVLVADHHQHAMILDTGEPGIHVQQEVHVQDVHVQEVEGVQVQEVEGVQVQEVEGVQVQEGTDLQVVYEQQ